MPVIYSISGSPVAVPSTTFGIFSIPFQTTAREKVRAALAWGLINNAPQSQGYYHSYKKVYTRPVNIEQVQEFPAIEVTWDERFTNSSAGGNSLGYYNRIADVKIRIFLKATDALPMTESKERAVADMEKYFGINYFIPDAAGRATIFNCVLESNNVLGPAARKPLGEVELTLKVYYRTTTSDMTRIA